MIIKLATMTNSKPIELEKSIREYITKDIPHILPDDIAIGVRIFAYTSVLKLKSDDVKNGKSKAMRIKGIVIVCDNATPEMSDSGWNILINEIKHMTIMFHIWWDGARRKLFFTVLPTQAS